MAASSAGDPLAGIALTKDRACYNRAKEFYAAGRYQDALRAFHKTTWLCKCKKRTIQAFRAAQSGSQIDLSQLPELNCACKKYSVEGVSESQVDFYSIAKRACKCGSDIKPCDSPIHLKALDGSAAACEAMKDLGRAYEFSVRMITIAPEQPEGYLRMGKVMRLRYPSLSRLQLRIVYQQGIKNVRRHGDAKHPKVSVLVKLYKSISKTDLTDVLPPELAALVLEKLSMRDLCRAMRVSRAWRHQALNPLLWRNLDFASRKPVSSRALANVLNQRAEGKTRSIRIRDAIRFGLDNNKLFMMIFNLPELRSFSLQASSFRSTIHPIPAQPQRPSQLTRLWMDNIFAGRHEIQAILKYVAPTLKELAIHRVWSELHYFFPRMANLQSLELTIPERIHRLPDVPGLPMQTEDWPRDYYTRWLKQIATRTPNLKRLCLVDNQEIEFDYISGQADEDEWSQLEELALTVAGDAKSYVFDHRLTQKLKLIDVSHYELLDRQTHVADEGSGDVSVVRSRLQIYENLQYFSCANVIPDSNVLRGLLEPSVRKHELRGLGIVYRQHGEDEAGDVFLDSFDFLCKEDIEVLGFSQFNFPYPDWKAPKMPYRSPTGLVSFLDWFKTFPNVHTAYVYPFQLEGCEYAVRGLVQLGVKTIYQDCLHGMEWDRVQQLAKEKGCTVIHRPRSMDPIFFKHIELL